MMIIQEISFFLSDPGLGGKEDVDDYHEARDDGDLCVSKPDEGQQQYYDRFLLVSEL